MQKTYSYLCATFALAAIILAGCTPPKNVRFDYNERASKIKTIGILAPDINYYDKSFGGVREKNDEETELASRNIAEALKAELVGRGFAVKIIPRKGERKESLEEILGLFSVIAYSYDNPITQYGADLLPYDYSVGPLDNILDPDQADALFLVRGFSVGSRQTTILMALADRTGALLWYDKYVRQGFFNPNIRNPQNAIKIVKQAIKRLPEAPR